MKITIKKITALILTVFMACPLLASCSGQDYDYELSEYISVPELGGEGFTLTDKAVSDKVSELIYKARKNAVNKATVTDRAAVNGDMLGISFVCYTAESYGTAAPSEIKAISDTNCTLVLGEGKYPKEFEDTLYGAYLNDKKTARLTYPADYSLKEYAGKSVVFEISVNQITALTVPEYDTEFVKNVSGFSTKEEFEKKLTETAKKELVLEWLTENSAVNTYPSEETERYSGEFVEYYTDVAASYGLSLEEYVRKKFFLTLGDFHIKAGEYAKELVKQDMIIYTLIRRYSVKLSDSEYTEGAKEYAEKYGYRSVAALEGKYGKRFVKYSLLKEKALSYAVENVTRNNQKTLTDIISE